MNGRDVDQLLAGLRAQAVVRRRLGAPAPVDVEKHRRLVDRAAWTIDSDNAPAGLGRGTDV